MRNKRHIFAALTAALLLSAPGMETSAAAGEGIPAYQETAWKEGQAAYEAKAAGDGRLFTSGTYQEAAWKDGRVVYEAKTAGNCRLVTDSTVTWSPGWYVAEGSVTIAEPITVSGAVNLILADGCTLNAKKGIVVAAGNSLAIYAQSGGSGMLIATSSDSAGIGGIGGIPGGGDGGSSGAITIHGGNITATSENGAGIGGGAPWSGANGGSGSNITIYGGSVTAQSTGTMGGAGIGGGGGDEGGGTGENINIYGGTVNAIGSTQGAGIGGGSGGNNNTAGAGINIIVSGGAVTAIGGRHAAGIGGGGGYSSTYTSCTGGTGSVTITGGIVDAKGGAGNSSGNYAGDPIGSGGNAAGTAVVARTAGIIYENGRGTVYGTAAIDGSCSVPAGYTLTVGPGGGFKENYAIYKDGRPVGLEEVKAAPVAGPATVKKCGHEGAKPAPKGNGTHTLDCPYCGYAGEENCAVSQDSPVLYTGEGEKEPACTEEGLGHRECVCGAVAESGVRVKALGHTGGKASCSTPAVCTRCGQPYGGTDKGSHGNTQVRGYVAQTCTAGGYTGDTYCADCGVTVETGSATPALGHAWQILREEAATVLAEGKRFYTCVRCAQTREESIPKLPASDSDSGNTSKVPTVSKEDMEKNSAKLDAGISVKWKGNAIALKWAKAAGADGYDIFAAQSGKKLNKKSPVKTVKSGKTSASITKIAGKKISGKNVYYVQISPWKYAEGKKVSIGSSRTYYAVGKDNKKYTNVKELKPAKKKYTLKKGKSVTIPVTAVKESKKKKLLPKSCGPALRYESSNEKIATVTSKGKVKAKKKGTCYIIVTALNGVRTKIKITVK